MSAEHKTHSHCTRFLLAILLLFFTPLLTACEDEGMAELVVEMALEWATENNLISFDAEGNISPNLLTLGIYEARRRWAGTTGDSALDAALEAGPVAWSIHQADSLAQQGMAEGDPALLDQAISLRPHDWSYRDQKAAILLEQGKVDEAQSTMNEAYNLVLERSAAGGNCRGLHQNMLRNRQNALMDQLAKNPDHPGLLEALMDAQDMLYQVENNGPDSPCQ